MSAHAEVIFVDTKAPKGAKYDMLRAFSDLLSTTSLDKITVRKICEEAGVNRQSFYYHFSDLGDLLDFGVKYTLRQAIGENYEPTNWLAGFRLLVEAVKENKTRVNNVYNSRYRYEFSQAVSEFADELLMNAVHISAKEHGIDISDEDALLVARFYRYVFVGILIQYVDDGMKEEPDEIVDKSRRLMDWTLEKTIRNVCDSK
jgi:AcrR family transcriptional regulator